MAASIYFGLLALVCIFLAGFLADDAFSAIEATPAITFLVILISGLTFICLGVYFFPGVNS